MFGMEKRPSEGMIPELMFDLENDLKDPKALRQLKEKVEERIMQLKNQLRAGGDKKDFEDTQALLQAYLGLQKVVGRVNRIT